MSKPIKTCLYCHEPIGWIRRWRGLRFCSAFHSQLYGARQQVGQPGEGPRVIDIAYPPAVAGRFLGITIPRVRVVVRLTPVRIPRVRVVIRLPRPVARLMLRASRRDTTGLLGKSDWLPAPGDKR